MRLDHGPQRLLLQVPELRLHERLQLRDSPFGAVAVLKSEEIIRDSEAR
jgi:hypothetical protein